MISCLLYSARSQNSLKPTQIYNGAFINPDRIYFENERQGHLPSETVTPQAYYRPVGVRGQNTDHITGGDLKNNNGYIIEPSVETSKVNSERSNGYKVQNKQFKQQQADNIDIDLYENKAQTNENKQNVPDAVTNFGINLFKVRVIIIV